MENKNIIVTDELMALYLEGQLTGEEKAAVENYLAQDEDAMDALFIARAELDWQDEATTNVSVFSRSMADYDVYAIAAASEKMDCAIKAQQMVLHNYGIDVGVEELTELAKKNGWFEEGKGSAFDFVGELLNHYGVEAVQMRNAGIYHIMHELSQGHKIIVGVDDAEQQAQDNVAKHVMLVAGIDTTDPDNLKVVVRDPSHPDREEVYPANDFVSHWNHTGCFMVATKQPAPLSANPEMEHFDYQLGYVHKFADVAYDEIVKRLADDGIIPNERGKLKRKLLLYLTSGLVFVMIGVAAFLIWRLSTPLSVKVNLMEDPSCTIPALPFTKGLLRCEYADNAVQTISLYDDTRTVTLNDIPYKYKNKSLHLVLTADGYQTIDTLLHVKKTITLPLRRNNDLGLVMGRVVDAVTEQPIANATVRLLDMETLTDGFGQFRIEIPFSKQDKTQHVIVTKDGYKVWDGIHRPSITDQWYIELYSNN